MRVKMVWRGVAAASILALLPVLGSAQCVRDEGAPDPGPPNVILIIADNLGWVDLPYFSPPINWNATPPQLSKEYRLVRPDLNALAARMLANNETDIGTLGEFAVAPLLPSAPTPTPYPPYSVIPVDNLHGASRYATPPPPSVSGACDVNSSECQPSTDVLQGFGGLQQLINHGIRFDRYYSPSGDCMSARASLLTGRNVQRHGVKSNKSGRLKHEEVTIAEYLKQGCRGAHKDCCESNSNSSYQSTLYCNGSNFVDCRCYLENDPRCPTPGGPTPTPSADLPCYTTGLIGKFDVGGSAIPAWQQGFDEVVSSYKHTRAEFRKSPLQCSPRKSSTSCCPKSGKHGGLYVGPDPSPGTPCPAGDCCDKSKKFGVVGGSKNGICSDNSTPAKGAGCWYGTRIYRDLAINFIKRHSQEVFSDNNQRKPFFLVVALNAMDTPDAPTRTRNHYTSVSGRDDPNTKYWAMLEEVDAAVGEIIAAVKGADTITQNNTIILFVGDNGEAAGNFTPPEHGSPALRGFYLQGNLFEGGIRVGLVGSACLASSHGVDTSGHLASHVDLFPTIAAAAGVPVPGALTSRFADHFVDGQSFYELLVTGQATPTPYPKRNFVYARYDYNGNPVRAIIGRPGVFETTPTPSVTPATHVCAWEAFNSAHVAFRGGSCTVCGANSDCTSTPCAVLGKVCVDRVPTPVGHCSRHLNTGCNQDTKGDSPDHQGCPGDAGCIYPTPALGFTSCEADSDCGTGKVCNHVHTLCTTSPLCDAGKVCIERLPTPVGQCSSNSSTHCNQDTNPDPVHDPDVGCPTSGGIDDRCIYPTPSSGFTRCHDDTECPTGQACNEVHTLCTKCVLAGWKLTNVTSTMPDGQLFDLTSNPEEDDRLDCAKVPAPSPFAQIHDGLETMVNTWDTCSASAGCQPQICESQVLGQPSYCQ